MLDVQGLRAGYGRIPILDEVAFAVNEGEFIGILGHNGMGKTTLWKALMGFLPATGGRVMFGHDDVTAVEPYRRALNPNARRSSVRRDEQNEGMRREPGRDGDSNPAASFVDVSASSLHEKQTSRVNKNN